MFPMFMYHQVKGSRRFETPDELAAAGKGWEDSPAKVGLVPEVPPDLGGMLHFPVPDQPNDDSVATEAEAEASAARAAKNARRASIPTTPATRRAAVKRR